MDDPRLEPDQTATLVVSVRLSSTAAGNYQNLAVIQQSRVTDPNPDDNTATADLFVPVADIDVDKRVNDTTAAVGETVTFSIGVRNLGPDAAADVVVADVLPAGLAYLASSATLGTTSPPPESGPSVISSPPTFRPPVTRHPHRQRTCHPDRDDHQHRQLRQDQRLPLRPRSQQQHRLGDAEPFPSCSPSPRQDRIACHRHCSRGTHHLLVRGHQRRRRHGQRCHHCRGHLHRHRHPSSTDVPGRGRKSRAGPSVTCTTTYTVTAGDTARGELSNTAHARGADRDRQRDAEPV